MTDMNDMPNASEILHALRDNILTELNEFCRQVQKDPTSERAYWKDGAIYGFNKSLAQIQALQLEIHRKLEAAEIEFQRRIQ